MTAAIIVMNSGAVALAADSAVTIPLRRGTKQYQGACKLVTLHATAPVAVLWYGSPAYLGVPWEVVVKEYRAATTTRHPHLQDYAEDFLKYLAKVPRWGSTTTGEPPASVLVEDLFATLERILDRKPADRNTAVAEESDRWWRSLRPSKVVLSEAQIQQCPELLQWLDARIAELVQHYGPLSDASLTALRLAARSAWLRLSQREPLHSGLVFAGFGDDDMLPVMCNNLVGVPVGDAIRVANAPLVKISAEKPAAIVPFAQNDQVKIYMEGISPQLKDFVVGIFREMNEDLPTADLNRLTRLLDQQIDDHGRPVVEAVRFLPKADLAEFARALIAFTAFRLRMSMSDETVGEPIDVAVVSRSEGVVWVHRKHYFPAALNPGFGQR